MNPEIKLLTPNNWVDYELLDSGNGAKLEKFGKYIIKRPAPQVFWRTTFPKEKWDNADATYQLVRGENSGQWIFRDQPIRPSWVTKYNNLNISTSISASRHLGFFPEQASHWDWIIEKINRARKPIKVLNLFGYTGIATLAAASAGAQVTHIDASRKSIQQARENQELSNLSDAPIRWICDDVIKFVQRETRRQSKYDAIILDPPKFGRGPKGEIWEFFNLLPYLLENCLQLLSETPLFVVITAYAIQAPSLSLYYSLMPVENLYHGKLTCGELALKEKSGGRLLSLAIYARWNA